MKLSELAKRALEIIIENPGVNMMHIAFAFNVKHSIYGMQRAASRAIAELRQAGLVEDCPRCLMCGRALSRSRRNVPLYPTNMSDGEKRRRQGWLW